ncbi:PucR family transcriptional regulator [Sinomonas terrae]|uniref:PucR family transcriptional regulator n=1 Tax=Sinomonas terrae TaxID=2908838 RepID=A0ABS9U803_9MICC|nr:PucR family transcriptional regulator [Sinomonas terrae]MCH6472405.1 PucR family transcriptional regulator [Sinomonas terrae]
MLSALSLAVGGTLMRLLDLVGLPGLDIRLRVKGAEERLSRPIAWCAPTEHMDPTPFLSVNALVLTSGMGLNVRDYRIWDAYAERLAAVPVAGLVFGTGPAHRELPEGLLTACEAHGLPLFELPPQVPFVLVMRQVEQTLAAERYDELRRGWDLADECTRLAAQGRSLTAVLDRVAESVEARVAVTDQSGFELVSAGEAPSSAPRSTLRLPSGEPHSFRLQVQGIESNVLLHPLLGPAAAVLAVQLSYTLGSRTPLHSREAARFMDALYDEQPTPEPILERFATEAGFNALEPWGALLVNATEGMDRFQLRVLAWQARIRLEERFRTVRFMEEPGVTTLLVQGPADDASLPEEAPTLFADTPGLSVVVAEAGSLDELPLSLRLARRHVGAPGVRIAPAADLPAIVEGLPGRGLVAMAQKLLAPLDTADPGGTLRQTLASYLRNAASSRAVCEELFIHRNTLAYRLRRIEDLMGISLDDGEIRTTCLLALRILQHQR